MKVLLLLTGGTIGSIHHGDVLDVGGDPGGKLKGYLERKRPEVSAEITCRQVMNVLSENMGFAHWLKIYHELREALTEEWDGIFVTHGTDTLAYTAVFLAILCVDARLPIFLISSQLSLEEPQADGYHNFLAGIDIVRQEKLQGVFVPVTENQETTVHLGGRLTQAQGFTHRFYSVGDIFFGKMADGCFQRNEAALNPQKWELEQYTPIKLPRIERLPRDCRILYIKIVPEMHYDLLVWKEPPSAVLVELYHSGTACTSPQNSVSSLLAFEEKCREQGIPLYGVSFDTRKSYYQTSWEMKEAGIKLLPNLSPEAAYVKLCIAYGGFENREEREAFLEQNIAFEKLEESNRRIRIWEN
jgi:L-asparaginase